jgi:predicted regulator of Ras-like GTPase activity (Roadblock/LC7/MglB family)
MTEPLLTDLTNLVPLPTRDAAILDNLRDQLAHVPGLHAFVVLADDGLALGGYGLADKDAVDTVAAACSGLASLGTALSTSVAGGPVRHVGVNMDKTLSTITSCANGTTLVSFIRPSPHAGPATAEVYRVARAFRDQLQTPARADAHPR